MTDEDEPLGSLYNSYNSVIANIFFSSILIGNLGYAHGKNNEKRLFHMLLKKIHKLRYSPLLLLLSCVELPEGKKPAPQNKGIYPLNISLFELPEGADKIKQINNNTL